MSSRRWKALNVPGHPARVRVTRSEQTRSGVYLWPSVGEYPVYDDYLYYAMVADEARNKPFRAAISRLARDASVVELGCGPDLLWSLEAVDAGARHVYAVEADQDSADQAAQTARERASGVVEVLAGEATAVTLPHRADLCIAELVGNIAGAEGMAQVLRDAWDRHLRPGGRVIPALAATRIAAINLAGLFDGDFHLSHDAADYTERVFRAMGQLFDLRFCIGGLDRSALCTTDEIVENLWFERNVYDYPDVELRVRRPGVIDGLLLWLELRGAADQEPLDALDTITNWLPVYVPLDAGDTCELGPDDRLALRCEVMAAEDAIHPHYLITGDVVRPDGSRHKISAQSRWSGGPFRASFLHRALFESESDGA